MSLQKLSKISKSQPSLLSKTRLRKNSRTLPQNQWRSFLSPKMMPMHPSSRRGTSYDRKNILQTTPPRQFSSCPLSYRYRHSDLKKAAEQPHIKAHTLYGIGGLYGNSFALKSIQKMKQQEEIHFRSHFGVTDPITLAFNGDFNWFNLRHETFKEINLDIQTGRDHLVIKGNVEEELSKAILQKTDIPNCGCDYPEYAGKTIAERANQIMGQLAASAAKIPGSQDIAKWLSTLPRFAVVEIGQAKVGILHGDSNSLSGWDLSVEVLEPLNQKLRQNLNVPHTHITSLSRVQQIFQETNLDHLLTTHTCLPFGQSFDFDTKTSVILNNGSAGMSNFKDMKAGHISRVSCINIEETPKNSIMGLVLPDQKIRFDLIKVDFDFDGFTREFLEFWGPESAAYASYWNRINGNGADFHLQDATRGKFVTYL